MIIVIKIFTTCIAMHDKVIENSKIITQMQRAIKLILIQCRETTMTYHCTKYRLLTTSKTLALDGFVITLKIEYDVGNRCKFIVAVFKI